MRWYSLMFSGMASVMALLIFVVDDVLAQDFAAPSGCHTTTLKNTLLFTQWRTGNPGEKNVVIGAYTVFDDDVEDTGIVQNINCVSSGPADGHPTHVTVITVTLAGGDLIAADIRAVKLYLENDGDGFLQANQDQQLGSDMPGTCLFSQCVFTFGRTTPLFTVGRSGSESFLITVDLGPNTKAGSNVMISVTAEANDLVTRSADPVSSDFSDTFRAQTSNIVLNPPGGGGCGMCGGINNGSGSPETGSRAVEFVGLKTRFGEKEIKPGTREAIAALIYVCEGGKPTTEKITINTYHLTIDGYPDALACDTWPNPDQFGTRILRLRVGVSGNAQSVGTLRLYDDANDNGILFEGGEFVLSAKPIGGVAIFGKLDAPLLASTRPKADPAPGMYAAQTEPAALCDSSPSNPQPAGTSKGCPHVLVLTFDVNSDALSGEVVFDVVFDVGNLPNEEGDIPTASSNSITTSPLRTRVMITDSNPTKSLARIIAEHSGSPDLIEDEDIMWAISKWAKNEPIATGIQLSDRDILNAISLWVHQRNIPAAVAGIIRRHRKP